MALKDQSQQIPLQSVTQQFFNASLYTSTAQDHGLHFQSFFHCGVIVTWRACCHGSALGQMLCFPNGAPLERQ
jgi:hypothetical protein